MRTPRVNKDTRWVNANAGEGTVADFTYPQGGPWHAQNLAMTQHAALNIPGGECEWVLAIGWPGGGRRTCMEVSAGLDQGA